MISLELIFKIAKDGNSITIKKGFKDGIEIIFSDCDNFRHMARFLLMMNLKFLMLTFLMLQNNYMMTFYMHQNIIWKGVKY